MYVMLFCVVTICYVVCNIDGKVHEENCVIYVSLLKEFPRLSLYISEKCGACVKTGRRIPDEKGHQSLAASVRPVSLPI